MKYAHIDRIAGIPRQSFFLLGCRGTGKSTWLRAQFPRARWIDLLDEARYQHYLADPSLFAAELRACEPGSWVVVDEIQRLPQLLNDAHRFMESSRLRFALCGSSVRKLKRAGVNLLAGRAVRRVMHPFLAEEMGNQFDLEDALRHGLLPVVWASKSRAESLEAYALFYLKEEIQAESLVRNLPSFARFLPVCALCHGQTTNLANIARDAGVARNTVESYMEILQDTLLVFPVTGYEARLRVKERKLPKWYWTDPGIVRAMKHQTGPLTMEERASLFEGLVAQTLRAYGDYRRHHDGMFYWASGSPARQEVDFVLARGRELVAIEAKSGRTFQQKWCSGLRAMGELKAVRRRMLVYPAGPRLKTEDGIEAVSFQTFSQMLAADTLWP